MIERKYTGTDRESVSLYYLLRGKTLCVDSSNAAHVLMVSLLVEQVTRYLNVYRRFAYHVIVSSIVAG